MRDHNAPEQLPMTVTPAIASLAPRLIVENVDEAIKVYEATIGAELIERYARSLRPSLALDHDCRRADAG
jgi:hypothetical protein